MADKSNPFSPFADLDFSRFGFGEMLKNIHAPGFDPEEVLESQRKNLEALSRASQITAEGMGSVARRQAEFLAESMNELAAATEKLSASTDAQELLSQQGELMNKAFERALGNMRELADMISESNTEAFDTISRRVEESIDELQDLAESGGGTEKK